jgi:hypothetical protein
MYQFALDRDAGSDEVGAVAKAAGHGRAGVALGFVLSGEFRVNLAGSLYGNVLHRGASHGEMEGWASSAVNMLHMRESFQESHEFEND